MNKMKEVLISLAPDDSDALRMTLKYYAKDHEQGYTQDKKYYYIILLREWYSNGGSKEKLKIKYLFPL